MKEPVATQHDSVKRALAIWRLLLRDYHPRDFAIRFWDASPVAGRDDFTSFYAGP